MPEPCRLEIIIVAVVSAVILASCAAKPMPIQEEARIKNIYLDKHGSEMTRRQKQIFMGTRLNSQGDAEKLLENFRARNRQSSQLEDRKSEAAGEIRKAVEAGSSYGKAVGKKLDLERNLAAASPKARKDLADKLKKAKLEAKQFEKEVIERIRAVEKLVTRTPFTMEEKKDIRSRLALLARNYKDDKRRLKQVAGKSTEPHAGRTAPVLDAIRSAKEAVAGIRALVEDEEILAAKAEQVGVEKVRGDYVSVHKETLAAFKLARESIAGAKKLSGKSGTSGVKKKAFREEITAIESKLDKLHEKSQKLSRIFKK
ncbi:MAG: hypothetical protein E3J72_19630 [Planctomycetota bacterium]|nr:MAG: hypothetical protein E3J72_19630 [Planctomycetota bacterium]